MSILKSAGAPVFVVCTAIVGWLAAAESGAQSKPKTTAAKPAVPAPAPPPAQAAKPQVDRPAASAPSQPAADLDLPPQTVLTPGLYLFQTRTRDGTCNDAPRTGYITSAVATLDGVPGARSMTMQLVNSKYWPTWSLTIHKDDSVSGSAIISGGKDESKGTSRFEMRSKKDRFQGVGSRSYPSQVDGKPVRCTLNYDVLLKLLD